MCDELAEPRSPAFTAKYAKVVRAKVASPRGGRAGTPESFKTATMRPEVPSGDSRSGKRRFLAIFLIGFAAFAGSRRMQRSGPRIVAITGGAVYGLGVFLANGLLAGIGLGLGYIVPLRTLPK